MGFVLSITYFAEQNFAAVFSLTGASHFFGFRAGMNYYPAGLDYYGHLSLSVSNVNDLDYAQQGEKGGPVVTSLLALNFGIGANTPAFNFADTETNPDAYFPGQLYFEAGVSRIFALARSKDTFPIPIEDGYLFKKAWFFFPYIELGCRFGDVE